MSIQPIYLGQPMYMQGQQSPVITDMYQGAKESWGNTVGGKTYTHLHQFIYQHLKNHFQNLVNNFKYFTYVTDKKFHTGVSINEFDFHIGRKRNKMGLALTRGENKHDLVNEYIQILGNPLTDPNINIENTKPEALKYFVKNEKGKLVENPNLFNNVMQWNDSNSYFKIIKVPTSQTNEEGELEKAYNEVIKNIREKSKDTFVKIFYNFNLGIFRGGKTKNKKSKKNSTRRKR